MTPPHRAPNRGRSWPLGAPWPAALRTEGVRAVHVDVTPVIAGIARVDPLADAIEPFRRWLGRFPTRG